MGTMVICMIKPEEEENGVDIVRRMPTVYNMCYGCVREFVCTEWFPGVGFLEFNACEAYAWPANTPWARQNLPCPAFSDGKQSN
jgi:hypothetical protein